MSFVAGRARRTLRFVSLHVSSPRGVSPIQLSSLNEAIAVLAAGRNDEQVGLCVRMQQQCLSTLKLEQKKQKKQ